MEKRYAIYEGIKNGDDFSRFIDAQTEEEALRKAEAAWEHMSEYDQNKREYFDLALSEPCEDAKDDPDYMNVPAADYDPIKSWV